ncbi:hypothetical protein [Methanospirillum lacunae]|uniref:Uncharacterized protein n=1 Tax=Methanospirillum lacunae TaxID=668570 RepID=A0A2V2MUS9_9EURY|nr:hypothetical protein [Methanospirillum lacunae]PWR71692.1 hypothetical protein DK846_12670 [Methanospirillum lacunae]
MTGISETVEHWFGFCRKSPAEHTLQRGIDIRPDSTHVGPPRSGGDGSRTIRGLGLALSGMKTLGQNRQLLWFTFLSGLVLMGNIIGQGVLSYTTWIMLPNETEWVILNSIIELATLFCLVFLLTSLVLSISYKKDHASFFEGFTRAKKYWKAILSWSLVLTIAGMLLFNIYFYAPDWLPRNHLFPNILGTLFGSILNLLIEFPFNPIFTPYILFDSSRYGGLSLVSLIYPSGIMQAAIFSEINLLLFILTPFVIPFIVLEQKTIREAVVGSFAVMKKTWDEAVACTVFLGVVTFGVFLTYPLVQVASTLVIPDEFGMICQENVWIALALVYDIALFCFVIVMATVGEIASLDLYKSAKIREIAIESANQQGL